MKMFLLLSTLLFLTSAASNAQELERANSSDSNTSLRRNIISMSPLKSTVLFNLSYHRSLSSRFAVGGGVHYTNPIVLDGDERAFGAYGEVRFYPSAQALTGFYVATNSSVFFYSSVRDTVTAWTINGLAGWQIFFGEHFTLGLGAGLELFLLSKRIDFVDNAYLRQGFLIPTVRFDVGYGF